MGQKFVILLLNAWARAMLLSWCGAEVLCLSCVLILQLSVGLRPCWWIVDKSIEKQSLGSRWIVDVSWLSMWILFLKLDRIVKEPFTVSNAILNLGRVRALSTQFGTLLARLLFLCQNIRWFSTSFILWLLLQFSGNYKLFKTVEFVGSMDDRTSTIVELLHIYSLWNGQHGLMTCARKWNSGELKTASVFSEGERRAVSSQSPVSQLLDMVSFCHDGRIDQALNILLEMIALVNRAQHDQREMVKSRGLTHCLSDTLGHWFLVLLALAESLWYLLSNTLLYLVFYCSYSLIS